MKKIKAYIKSHKLSDVTLALHKVEGFKGMSVTEVKGFGRHCDDDKHDHENQSPSEFESIAKIEIFCLDEQLDGLIETIEKAAHTGLCGDGKIYVLPVEQAVRISTGQRGDDAV